jgi:mRNA-degrading endonuclease RelE of RelBE toxin-antitoxin system
MPYAIEFAESVKLQLKQLTAHGRAMILSAIEKSLAHEPLKETRNRKPLRPNPIAPWELRVRNFRVFYDISHAGSNVVRILAVGQKKGDRFLIAGKEVKL